MSDEPLTLLPRRQVEFIVLGDPASQAGMRSVPIRGKGGAPVMTKDGRPMFRQITDGSTGLKTWRAEVSHAAGNAAAEIGGMILGPVEVWIEFRFPMPVSRPKWARLLGSTPRQTKPDGDKLQRAVWDSLKTGGLIEDDARVVRWHGAKLETTEDWHGARIKVAEVVVGPIA